MVVAGPGGHGELSAGWLVGFTDKRRKQSNSVRIDEERTIRHAPSFSEIGRWVQELRIILGCVSMVSKTKSSSWILCSHTKQNIKPTLQCFSTTASNPASFNQSLNFIATFNSRPNILDASSRPACHFWNDGASC